MEVGSAAKMKLNTARTANTSAAWTSSDPAVASVDKRGIVIAKGNGNAVITASSKKLAGGRQTFRIMELFSDADCTKAVSKPQAVTVTNGTKASTTFTGLSEGTYYVAETNAEGTQIITKPADTTSYTGYGVDGNKTAVMISSSSLTGSAAIVNRYTPAGNKTPKPKHVHKMI